MPEKVSLADKSTDRKLFILDTNVLLHDSQSLFHFGNNYILLPPPVLEELDTFKTAPGSKGYHAREVARVLDYFTSDTSFQNGYATEVELGQGTTLLFTMEEEEELPFNLSREKKDNQILGLAYRFTRTYHYAIGELLPVVLVTKDVYLRVKARSLGIDAEDYESDKVNVDEVYTGHTEVYVEEEELNLFYQQKSFDVIADEDGNKLFPNQGVTLTSFDNPKKTALTRVSPNGDSIFPLIPIPGHGVSRIKPLNREQHYALDLLLRDDIKLVTLIGKAGTGKTLLALAAGLHKVADERKCERLLVTKPLVPMGREPGYLPGNLEEKMAPWMQSILDNLDQIVGVGHHQELVQMGLLRVEALTYIRGRSIPNQYFIVDEAQNLTPHEVKTIITRAGKNTKIVLTGDPEQIDNPYVDCYSNGLTYVMSRFKGDSLAGHITLTKGERSDLAERATVLL